MCLYPTLIRNRKYTETKKNGGIIPPVSDIRVMAVPVGCGKCMECRKQKARNWQIRLLEEVREQTDGKFVTLTFSNDSIKKLAEECNTKGYELDNEIATLAMRRFLERWRKKYKRSVRHFAVTELGHNGTENIHIHAILWSKDGYKELQTLWAYGFVWTGDIKKNYVNSRTVNYIIKYILKADEKHPEYKSKILTSAGIGANYTNRWSADRNRYNKGKTDETYRLENGRKSALPTYYRNKIYNDNEREKLWIEKLDKQERYVGGEKVDISNGLKEYYEIRDHYRKINKELGYGTNEVDKDKIAYEQVRRQYMIDKRIQASGGVLAQDIGGGAKTAPKNADNKLWKQINNNANEIWRIEKELLDLQKQKIKEYEKGINSRDNHTQERTR